MKLLKPCIVYIAILIAPPALAQNAPDGLVIPPFKAVPERKPAFPLKTSRSLYSAGEVKTALSNIEQFPSARKIRQEIVDAADYWLGLSDKEILRIMPDARVPRGFDLCAAGCPVHGDSVFKVGGFYPWIIDPMRPFKVKCPIGGEIYPSNDYGHYYDSGFREKGAGSYTDDGWGWVSPEGERYWFVAYANHWMWYDHTIPGILALARAYLLTEKPGYAGKAAFMLYRLAEIYPSMNHEDQSRYGLMQQMRGAGKYKGKIVNHIWETNVIRDMAEAYDHVWDYLDKDTSLQAYTRKSGQQIRAFIEANLLEDGLDAIAEDKIVGNFGMHQNAMLYAHLVRQHAGKEAAIEKLTEEPSPDMSRNGLQYALYNQVFRDGMPMESPGYNAHWIKELVHIADVLKKGGKDIFGSRLKSLLDAPLDIVALGRYTPDWGDGGSVTGGLTARFPDTYQIGYNQYRDKRYLGWIGRSGDSSFTTFGSLFLEALPKAPGLPESRAVLPQKSRLFAGYGLGILNNTSDRTALALTYGMHYSHYHWDFLNIELFANGQKMMPDLGYPDAMNSYVAPVYTWSQNTISHNTVVVDEKKQDRNLPGTLHDFYEGGFTRMMDASSPAYQEAGRRYRRNVVMVDADSGQSYVVDFFHVSGGKQHDYSLHGPPGTVITLSDQWSAPAPGTLAGESVAPEEIYDDEKLKKDGQKIGYGRYGGSGFQHLFNVQSRKAGSGLIEYRHLNDPSARLRLHTLTPDLDDLFIADAYDRPRAKAYLLKYLIARRKSGGAASLKSTFVSVFEPFKSDNPLIESAVLENLPGQQGHYVVVKRPAATDVIIHDTTSSVKKLDHFNLETDAATAVVTLSAEGKLLRAAFSGGSYLTAGGKTFRAEKLAGKVEKADARNGVLTVRLDRKPQKIRRDLPGAIAYFRNGQRTTVHPVENASVKKDLLTIRLKDDLLVGRLRLDKAENGNFETQTSLVFQKQYNGAALLNDRYEQAGRLIQLNNGKIELDGPPALPLQKGDVLWLSNVGAGDEFEIRPGFSWVAP